MFLEGFMKAASISSMGKKLIGGGTAPKGGKAGAARVTPTIPVGDPVKGLKGITGAPAMAPFARPLHNFGTRGSKGLVSRTAVAKGLHP